MKYKLIQQPNDKLDTISQILNNRGISLTEVHHYLNTTDKDISDIESFGIVNIQNGVKTLISTIQNNEDCLVLVDCDCDGYTASAIMINYLYDLFPAYVENHLKYYLHENKTHGLSDCMDYIEKHNFKLIIIPDAGSNDYEYHKILKDKGINILILDHHEAPYLSEDAIVINNQLSDYPNKQLSGAGVVWQFCRYIDKILNKNFADNYIDLCALGNCGDMMSLKSIETKHIINKGFKEENIKNPFIYGMAEKNSFSLGDKITPIGAAFYIVPYINSMVRSGTLEEKEQLFNSMLKFKAFDTILSNKRGHKLGETERLIDQALRTAMNVKNRQTREQDKSLEFIETQIKEKNMMEHKVLIFLLEPGIVDPNIAGLIANKIMAKYQRPVLILTEHREYYGEDIAIDKIPIIDYNIIYQGSARGYSKSGIDNFKDICENTGLVEYAIGHQNAFGIGIKKENISAFIEKTDIILKDMDSEPLYYVDYIFKGVDVKPDIILSIASLNDLWGQDIDESFICIEKLKVTKETLTLMSPDKKPTLKITLPNKISIIKFGSSQEEYERLYSEGYVEINLIGKCNINEWNGNISAQILIEDYEIIGQNKYNF